MGRGISILKPPSSTANPKHIRITLVPKSWNLENGDNAMFVSNALGFVAYRGL